MGGGFRQGARQGGSRSGDSGAESGSGQARSDRSQAKATSSQIEFLKTLASEWRGEEGVSRLESRIGKPLDELAREEADSWIEKLTPSERNETSA